MGGAARARKNHDTRVRDWSFHDGESFFLAYGAQPVTVRNVVLRIHMSRP